MNPRRSPKYYAAMRNLNIPLAIGFAFAAGCAAAQFVVPPARAANVQRWEYLCFDANWPKNVQAKANEAGKQGWELVGSSDRSDAVWCMKRPVP